MISIVVGQSYRNRKTKRLAKVVSVFDDQITINHVNGRTAAKTWDQFDREFEQVPLGEKCPLTRCEGYRRYGGAFSLGLGRWEQCRNKAVVMLKVEQEQVKTMPACRTCWNEAKAHGLKILSAEPIQVNHETKP